MVKHFCDLCGVEISDDNKPCGGMKDADRLGTARYRKDDLGGNYPIEFEVVITSHKPLDICKYCILDAIASLDDRPMPAQTN